MRPIVVLLLVGLLGGELSAQKKKKKKDEEPITQTHEILPDPPAAVKVEASRLVFFTSPLSTKGLLSAQAHDAIVALRKMAHGATMVKLRAFVAGRGDARRVSSIVSEQFSEWKLPLPALTIVQVGALGVEGAQVLIEAVAEERKPVNLNGVEFLKAVQVVKPLAETGDVAAVGPLLEEALNGLAGEVVAVTCYVSSIDGSSGLEALMARKFPGAARTLVQAQRATGSGLARCEGVARRSMGNPDRLVLTGTLIGFGNDVGPVEGRLKKLLEGNGAEMVERRAYAVSRGFEGKLGSVSVVEGVGSNEATFAVEGVGLVK